MFVLICLDFMNFSNLDFDGLFIDLRQLKRFSAVFLQVLPHFALFAHFVNVLDTLQVSP